jgi:hypothetical protein
MPGEDRKMIKRLSTVAIMLVAACGGITVPSDPASQEGVIVERDIPTSFEKDRPTIWVKDALDDECGVIYVIAPDTDLFRRDDGGAATGIGVADLEVGARVRVWTGAVLRSCPGQATADAVELLART